MVIKVTVTVKITFTFALSHSYLLPLPLIFLFFLIFLLPFSYSITSFAQGFLFMVPSLSTLACDVLPQAHGIAAVPITSSPSMSTSETTSRHIPP